MLLFEFKAYGKSIQLKAVDEAIRTAKFIRNSCIRLWMDNPKTGKNDLQKYCAVLAAEFSFANELNSMARDLHRQSEHGLQFFGFTTTVKKAFKVKRGILNFKKIAVQLNIKHLAGNLILIASL